jgi:hypothetical protein
VRKLLWRGGEEELLSLLFFTQIRTHTKKNPARGNHGTVCVSHVARVFSYDYLVMIIHAPSHERALGRRMYYLNPFVGITLLYWVVHWVSVPVTSLKQSGEG